MHASGREREKTFAEMHVVVPDSKDKPKGPSRLILHGSHMSGSRVCFPLVDNAMLLCGVVDGLVGAEAAGFKPPAWAEKNQDWLRVWLRDVGLVNPKVPLKISRGESVGFDLEPLKGGATKVFDFLYCPVVGNDCFGVLTTVNRKVAFSGIGDIIKPPIDLNDAIPGAKSVRGHPDPEVVWVAEALPGLNMTKNGWHVDFEMFKQKEGEWPYPVVRYDLATQCISWWGVVRRQWVHNMIDFSSGSFGTEPAFMPKVLGLLNFYFEIAKKHARAQ